MNQRRHATQKRLLTTVAQSIAREVEVSAHGQSKYGTNLRKTDDRDGCELEMLEAMQLGLAPAELCGESTLTEAGGLTRDSQLVDQSSDQLVAAALAALSAGLARGHRRSVATLNSLALIGLLMRGKINPDVGRIGWVDVPSV